MARLRVVLYAEGPGETSGVARGDDPLLCLNRAHRAPGEIIPDEELGPGHVLVRRGLESQRVPAAAVAFLEGKKTSRGTRPRGSHLLDRAVLRQLLTVFPSREPPSLFVILVDRDGKAERRKELRNHVEGLESAPRVIAVAREEFEAWLVADGASVGRVLRSPVNRIKSPEGLRPREAKQILGNWIEQLVHHDKHLVARRAIAEQCDLSELCRRCPAFKRFLAELAQALTGTVTE